MQKLFALLKTKRFMPLFIAQFLGAFNDNVYRNALTVLVMFHIAGLEPSQRSFYVTLALGIFMLPFFLFSATAGILADKFNKARIIRITKFAEIFVMSFGVLGFIYGNLALLFSVLFITGTLSAFFGPLKYSILPDHLAENELIAGNSLVEAGTFTAIILGAIVGGLVISEHSVSLGMAGGLVFLLALLCYISTLFIPVTTPRPEAPLPRINFFKDIWAVLSITKQNKRVFSVVIGISWFWLIGAVLMSQFPDITKNILTSNQRIYTTILTVFCFGIGFGSILCNILLKGKISGRLVPVSIFLISVALFDLCYNLSNFPRNSTTELYTLEQFLQIFSSYRILLDILLIAIFGGFYSVPLYTIMQHETIGEDRSKTIAANNILNSFFMVAASVFSIIMLSKFNLTIPQLLLVFAVLNIFIAMYMRRTIDK